jgi:hypothetical protein
MEVYQLLTDVLQKSTPKGLGKQILESDPMSNIKRTKKITDARPISVFIRLILSFYIHC